ncbi:Ff.00g002440.m01.CDS01 [Fusarium sp. VM40]|nr:Ff.00g002440.m01.CDS01 [Fusarium sp. VM40]
MTSNDRVPKSAENEEPTASATQTSLEDDWQIITEEDVQPHAKIETMEKSEPNREQDPKEPLAEVEMEKEKCTDMQAQKGGVYPHREVEIPSYSQFIGNW